MLSVPKQYFITEVPDTPIGPLGLVGSQAGLARISLFGLAGLARENWPGIPLPGDAIFQKLGQGDAALDGLAEAVRQLREYFAGERKVFDLALDLGAQAPSRLEILKACRDIPFGQLRTYAQLAVQVGKPRAPILVGAAMAANPLPLVIPCHRVVGTDRTLHGFGAPGGISTKAWLLEMEGHRIVNQKLA